LWRRIRTVAFQGTFDGVIDPDRWSISAKIFFGLIGGGGGVIWLPGTGPVPVDPEPFKLLSALSPRKRDVLLGLALSEMANLVYDGTSRQELEMVGLRLLKESAQQIRLPGKVGGRQDRLPA
jgi:hypothetical protein